MPTAEVTLPGAASSVPTARRFVDSLLSSWGHPELGWTAAVCVSELAGNAALHARTPFTVCVTMGEGPTVRIEVRDGSRRLPAMRDYGKEATTGRGLRMLDRLAASWGVDVDPAGKTIWLLLDGSPAGRGGLVDDGDDMDPDVLLTTLPDDGEAGVPTGSTHGRSAAA